MLVTENAVSILILALILDRIVGDPDWLWSRVRHPVVLIGAAIRYADMALNAEHMSDAVRRRNGIIAIAGLTAAALLTGLAATFMLQAFSYGWLIETGIVAVMLAQKSLIDHVQRVAEALYHHGVQAGRKAVSMIVGRDVETLEESDIARAAIESGAENFSDGTIAPAFWYLIFGLPGLLVYKLVNTADSMIGHKNARYRQFGFASAMLDDVLNLLPARISAALIALVAPLQGGSLIDTVRVIGRDASDHASPNAGWPEAAMAGAMNIALGGPRSYGDRVLPAPWLNASGERQLSHAHISAAAGLVGSAWLLVLIGLITVQLLKIAIHQG